MANKASNYVPSSAIHIDRFAELEEFAGKFATGGLKLLGVVGHAGTRKSRTFHNVLEASGKRYWYLKGNVTPFILYQQLYFNRDAIIVIDDADTLFADRACIPLLKSLLETEAVKVVSWHSKAIDDETIPRSFTTSSPVAILCNQWTTVNQNMRAVEDRGIFLHFTPSVYEIHRRIGAADWLNDDEVFEFVGRHLHLITEPSMRYYVKASEMRRVGIADWQQNTLKMMGPHIERLAVLNRLIEDTTFGSEAERVAKFTEITGQSQATFYRDREMLLKARGGEAHGGA